jgi:transaldolase/glucose-6-phosphate isomerase
MGENPLRQLQNVGQCVWIDNLSRDLILSGKLGEMMEEDGIVGVTSNPTIFQKAISGSTLYDGSLKGLLEQGVTDPKELFLGLAIEDIRNAADLLAEVYGSSKCLSGYVSIEVSPDLASDTDETIKEAKRLFSAVAKKNVFVKVPATKQGLPAIEQLTREGINVNVTLLFSVERYREVAGAYIRGLQQRAEKGKALDHVVSVASFFVSRVDTLMDKLLEQRLGKASSGAERERITRLMGKAAVANAKIAYQEYEKIIAGPGFLSLRGKGAHVQRLLWGSTGTKNQKYSDIKYVEELVAKDTINTMPEATIKAFKDHGKAKVTIRDGLDEAKDLFGELKSLGIDMDDVTGELEKEGVKAFSDSYFALLDEIARRRDRILAKRSA